MQYDHVVGPILEEGKMKGMLVIVFDSEGDLILGFSPLGWVWMNEFTYAYIREK